MLLCLIPRGSFSRRLLFPNRLHLQSSLFSSTTLSFELLLSHALLLLVTGSLQRFLLTLGMLTSGIVLRGSLLCFKTGGFLLLRLIAAPHPRKR